MRNPLMIGQRVYLRPEETGDAEPHARIFAEETDDFIDDIGRVPASPIMMEHGIREATKSQPPRSVTFSVCLKESDDVIGWVGLGSIDYVNRTAESYSTLRPGEYRGRGYGTEAKLLLLEYGFDRLHLHVIHSYVFGANERSAAALVKQGYKPAGRLKWDYPRRGVYTDTLLFDIKRDEWLDARSRLQR